MSRRSRARATAAAAALAAANLVIGAGAHAEPDPLTAAGVLWRPLTAAARASAPPAPSARAWILVDADNGNVLAAQRARTQQLPASTLKTLTAVTLLPRLDMTQVYTARSNDAGIHGSGAGLVVGGTYTVEQLFLGMLLPSGNDAATALTHVYNPDGRKAIALMNATARRLGATGTVAVNPTGLPVPGQRTTAADMAIIARAAIANPEFRRLAQTKTVQFPGRMPKAGAVRKTYQLQNENPFIKHGVAGTIGGKTGFTRAALRTYWVAVKRGNRTLIVVILGFVGSYQKLASDLLTWGFKQGSALGAVATLPPVRPVYQPPAVPTSTPNASVARPARPQPAQHDVPRSAATVLLLAMPLVILTRRAMKVHARLRPAREHAQRG
ncbi:MAG: hypothetical protein KGP01_01660 [Actinomycetales bacterium]|nr:hypothetical protein [Actinomycetales bacterium]